MAHKILLCPSCGNRAPQELEYQTISNEEVFNISDLQDSFTIEFDYFVARCTVCDSILMYYSASTSDFVTVEENMLCYPHQKKIGSEIPDRIAKNYAEAKRIQKASPVAFAILIRRGLEFICDHQKAEGHTLKQKMDNLAAKGIIPRTLTAMGDTLRFLGNISAHATDFDIDWSEALIMDDFYLSMIEYIYVAPSKISKLKESIDKKMKQS